MIRVDIVLDAGEVPKFRADEILIDLSIKDKVTLYNAVDIFTVEQSNPEGPSKLKVRGTLQVDISALTGPKFSPGLTETTPKITAVVTEFDHAIC